MTDGAPVTRRPARRGYAICFVGRGGSNLLCEYLTSTGVLGRPLEYFNAAGRRMFGDPGFPEEPEKQIDRILTSGATDNGIYGLKISPGQFDVAAKAIPWTTMLPDLAFVALRRRDLLGQAISMARAVQTGQWRSTMAAKTAPAYDGERIRECLRMVTRDYVRWDMYFARNGIDPLVLVYEDLVADPQSEVDKVARLFGLGGRAPVKMELTELEIQRDAITEDWKLRFYEQYRNLDELDPA